jgi:hypothetical protein
MRARAGSCALTEQALGATWYWDCIFSNLYQERENTAALEECLAIPLCLNLMQRLLRDRAFGWAWDAFQCLSICCCFKN